MMTLNQHIIIVQPSFFVLLVGAQQEVLVSIKINA